MNSRKDLETRIAEKLKTISADNMQRLAYDYARIRFPERFPHFDFLALSPEGKTRDGWPDGYILLNDESRDGVEATASKSKAAVLKHLGEDVANVRSRMPKLSSFVFVSGHPEVQPNDDEMNELRRGFVDEAGLLPERVNLVFGKQLVLELAAPEFARTLIEILGIQHSPKWFKQVRPKLPPGVNPGDFIPSPDDYKSGRVHRPLEADVILNHLKKEGRALLRGVGASGKTVLAWLLALETVREGGTAYYRDLAGLVENPEAENGLQEDLICFGHPRVLFILDNIHLDESIAKGLALAWDDLPVSQRPRLLLVGRELHTHRGSSIADLDIPTVPLKARQAEVRGVYRRLASRRRDSSEIREPPPEWLDRWVETFGGDPASPDTTTDLIAFSAAVQKRLPDLEKGVWNLTVQDAIDEIREAYLKKLSSGETSNLMRLASLSEFELSLSELALVDKRKGFDIANRQMGLVFQEHTGGKGQYVVYRLAHAALGRLLLAAAYEPVDVINEQCAIALADLYTGFAVAHALTAANQPDRARTILSALMEDPGRLLDVPRLSYSLTALRLVQKYGIVPLIRIGSVLVNTENRSRLIERALLTPLGDLQSFLAYAEKTGALKIVFDALAEALGQENYRPSLIERALLTPLDKVQVFLAYAEKTVALKTVFKVLAEALGQEKYRSRLIERALLTPLGDLQSFLAYAEETVALKTVFDILIDELVKEKNRPRLVDLALLTPVDHLQTFLAYAKKTDELRAVFAVIVDALIQEKNRPRLVDLALLRPLDHLQTFLAYAEKTDELKAVSSMLVAELANETNRHQLVKRFVSAPLDKIVSILSSDAARKLWQAVLMDVDAEEWERIRLQDNAPNMDAFVRFQQLATVNGRPELIPAPALKLVRLAELQQWQPPQGNIRNLSHVLRCAERATEDEIRRFLQRIATADWVDQQIGVGAQTGGLAGSLLALSTTLHPELRAPFLRPSLRRRVLNEISTHEAKGVKAWVEALSLLGAAAALGLRLDSVKTNWPDKEKFNAILESRLPDPELTAIDHLQVQFWLGLREMRRLRSDGVSVSAKHGDAILTLWRATHESKADQPVPAHVRELNAGMIAWLVRCRQAGWRLVKDA